MNIIEAIKSGKKFRRKGWTAYYDLQVRPDLYFVLDEIMADDWEIEPDSTHAIPSLSSSAQNEP
jgi:ribosome-binding factor A